MKDEGWAGVRAVCQFYASSIAAANPGPPPATRLHLGFLSDPIGLAPMALTFY
jgi:hypothetical protein